MILLKRAVLATLALFVSAVLLGLTFPRSTRALVSSLVTVANTLSNPVPTADASRSATQNIELTCAFKNLVVFGTACSQSQLGPGPQYTVPAGQNLIITSMDITPQNSSPGFTQLALDMYNPQSGDFPEREFLSVPNAATTQLQYPVAGIVIGPGWQPLFGYPVNTVVVIRGFLSPN